MNKKGMTIVELIVSFALTIVIALFLTEIVLFLKEIYVSNGIKMEIVNKQTIISDRIYSLLDKRRIIKAGSCEGNCVELTFDDGTYSQIAFNNKKVVVGDYVTELPNNCIVGNIVTGTSSFNNANNFNSLFQIYVPITSSLIKNKSFDINLVYQYNNNNENWSYNGNSNNYHLSIPSTETILINSNFNPLDNVNLVDGNSNLIDVDIQYTSKPSFDIGRAGEYIIDYYTFYKGKTYISTKKINVVKNEYTFNYTGNAQTFNVPYSGWYKIELWGAQGGSADGTYIGGNGAFITGKIYLSENENLYIYVGGMGENCIGHDIFCDGGYNGGGSSNDNWSSASTDTKKKTGGGGATDIRLKYGLWNDNDSLNSRIMVAAGGGGGSIFIKNSTMYHYSTGGDGGTLIGEKYKNSSTTFTQYLTEYVDATQSLPGSEIYNNGTRYYSGFGRGFSSYCGGGGGYYGGIASVGFTSGGSSFISGYSGVNAITSSSSLTPTNNTMHYSGKYFIDGKMQAGINEGNGKAKITYLSETKPNRVNTKLNNVRYIKDCTNGNSKNNSNNWVELQAIKDGINLAKNGTFNDPPIVYTNYGTGSWGSVIDGDITSENYAYGGVGAICITLDLQNTYDLDEIAVWHYFTDNRTYNDNITSVSSDNINWIEVINKIEPETSNGKRANAYNE